METVCADMMELARENLDPAWKNGQVIVVETQPGRYHHLKIHDFMDPAVREPLEDQLIDHLMRCKATGVLHCLCTMDGRYPDIPSWHFRSRLVEMDPVNLETKLILRGPGDAIRVKSFSDLLPRKSETEVQK